MKVPYLLAALAVTCAPALASAPIAPDRARGFEGSDMTVEGLAVVRHATLPRTGGMELALKGRDGGSSLIAYIPDAHMGNFPDLASLEGKVVDVTGVVALDEGQPEITVTSPDQLVIAR